MMKKTALLSLLLTFVVIFSCKKETNNGPNLYEGISGQDSVILPPGVDSASIEGLHRLILQPRCATNGCHDGSFEPDYRTIQSSYNTLVYANVVKQVNPYKFRAVPYDTAKSWLWCRVTTNDAVLGRMPLYSPALSSRELANISKWIMNGCPDMAGNKPKPINYEPEIYGFAIYNGSQRLDSIREPDSFEGSSVVPPNTNIDIWIGVLDDSTLIYNLTGNTLKLSTSADDFSSAQSYTATFTMTPFMVPNFFGTGAAIPFYYKVTVNTGQWNVGDVVYMRYYTKDAHHNYTTEIPEKGTHVAFKTRYALKIKN